MSGIILCDAADAESTANLLRHSTILGFDSESDGEYADLVQLSTDKAIYLFRTFPPSLKCVLESSSIVKVGVDLGQDEERLRKRGIELRGTIDLQLIARTMDVAEISVDGLGRKFIPNFPGKKPYCVGWKWTGQLSEEQITYAGQDAAFALLIYLGMLRGINIATVAETNWEDGFLEWMSGSLPMKYDRLVNKCFNSYGPLVKRFGAREREMQIRKAIEKFLTAGKLTRHSNGMIYSTQ